MQMLMFSVSAVIVMYLYWPIMRKHQRSIGNRRSARVALLSFLLGAVAGWYREWLWLVVAVPVFVIYAGAAEMVCAKRARRDH